MRKHSLIVLLGILLLALPGHMQAQEPPPPAIVIMHTVPEHQDDSLALSVYFTLQDRNGNPVLKSNFSLDQQGEIELRGQRVPATVGDPQAPIKIAMLIDNSGSMNQVIGDANGQPIRIIDAARDAAKQAIDSAPANASFAVFSFAQQPVLQSGGFLRRADQADLIKDAIGKFAPNPPNTGNTCVSDAANAAIDYLAANSSDPAERKAIILFTDGKDKEGNNRPNNGNNCSNLDIAAVARKAKQFTNTTIPIYTIGPCNAACDNINRTELETLARDTKAFPAIGSLQDITALFQQIMDVLNSQWVIQAHVLPRKGPNTAILHVKPANGGSALPSATADFESERDYKPTPTIAIANQQYLPDTDTYAVSLRVTNPEQIGKVIAGVYDRADGGTQISPDLQGFENITTTFTFTQPTDNLIAGREYFLQIRAIDKAGAPIQTAEGKEILTVDRFTYNPKLALEIISVEPSWETSELVITVAVRGAGGRALSVQGTITEEDTGKVMPFTETLNEDGQLRPPLPEMIQQARRPTNYLVQLTLEDGENVLTAGKGRLIEPLKRPGLLWRIISSPIVLIGIPVLLVLIVGASVVLRMRARRRPIPDPFTPPGGTKIDASPSTRITAIKAANATVLHPPEQPQAEPPKATIFSAPEQPQKRLHVRVVATPDPAQIGEIQVTEFPCIIGRKHATVTISGDQKVSQAHIEVAVDHGHFKLTDNSRNGTFIGDTRLNKGESVEFTEKTQVRLGPNTTIELDPQR